MSMELRHYDEGSLIHASADEVFQFVDTPENLAGHMEKPTWKMLWGWMRNTTDDKGAHEVGSVIRLDGSLLGTKLSLIEKVTEREAPYYKAWQTFDKINLVVIGHYTMGFKITPQSSDSNLNVFIDYELPRSRRTHWLGHLLGDTYAKWCVREMLHAAEARFQSSGGTHVGAGGGATDSATPRLPGG